MTDVETVARAAGGDEAAQRVLYETSYLAAFRLAYLLLQDACDAEEVVQDTFVYLLRNLQRYDPARGSFRAWLRVALVSRCRNKRRCRRLQAISLEVLEAGGRSPAGSGAAGDPAGLLEVWGRRRAVWQALQQISPAARDALILRYYEELPYAEIAAILGCSAEAARARVAYGKAQLRRLLAAPEEEAVRDAGIVRTAKAG